MHPNKCKSGRVHGDQVWHVARFVFARIEVHKSTGMARRLCVACLRWLDDSLSLARRQPVVSVSFTVAAAEVYSVARPLDWSRLCLSQILIVLRPPCFDRYIAASARLNVSMNPSL